jgi:formylglycine-generating enzyme required for sulfatase activity
MEENLMKKIRCVIWLFCLIPAVCFAQTGVAANMVLVEWGIFQMGSDDGDKNEKPVHKVTMSSFLMNKYEVSQGEWNSVMEDNPSNFKGDTLPVENVSWHEAVEFCNRLSAKEGLTPVYKVAKNSIRYDFHADGYRLPTEAEWEYAAKGGKKDYLALKYSGGETPDKVAWYKGNSRDRTHPVGTKAPNSLGLYDMSGNVGEWCWDRFGSYRRRDQADPIGPSRGVTRVCRGGGWSSDAQSLRSTIRGELIPDTRNGYLGFRVCRSVI